MFPQGAHFSVNQQRQQQMNRTLILHLMRKQGSCSRAELAKLSGLQPATLTKIIGEFIDRGLVIEEGFLEGDKGRRAIGVHLNGRRFRVLGAMVTRTYCSILDMGLSGEVYGVDTFPVAEGSDALTVIQDMCSALRHLMAGRGEVQTLAVGFAMPGPYVERDGELVFVTNLSGWDDLPLRSILQGKFDIPVFVVNDANAGAYAQSWFRPEEPPAEHLVYVVAGQGIGCGILSDGVLLLGGSGIAGEIGHTTINYDGPRCECGNRGCLEKYCSTLVLRKRLQERIGRGETTAISCGFSWEEAGAAIRAGDPVVCQEYIRACDLLAIGIVNLINQIDPNIVIIGDELAELAPELMLSTVRDRVERSVRPMVWNRLTIEVSSLPHNPILMGAGVVAAQKVFEDPFAYISRERGEVVGI